MKKYAAEAIGTGALVLLGCGAATLGDLGGAPNSTQGVGPLAVLPIAFAFALTVTAIAYGVGPVSGCHINPAVSIGVWSAGRLSTLNLIGYIIAQCLGAIVGAAILYAISNGRDGGYDVAVAGLGQNGWSNISTASAFLAEFVGTFLFLVVIHIALIRVTGASVNPARSLGPAVFVGGKALQQLWLFFAAPLLGGVTAGLLFRWRSL
ncbi:aquaporin [Methylosinus sp. Sm6]|nr:aquaporin [Methylosinus sp. Sm6]MBY6241237.1 aquaporin [Methylosinus sp. Sm6]